MPKGKRSSRQTPKLATYIVAISKWDWDFYFGVNQNKKLSSDPYSDYRHLKITGIVISPARYKDRAAELIFLPDKKLNEENRQLLNPVHAGTLSSERAGLTGLLSIPQDVVGDLLQMLSSNRYRWIVLYGDAMRYRRTSIRSFHFQTTFTEDDLPADS